MTPRTNALAYRIWAWASPRGWDVTAGEIADALSDESGQVTPQMVGSVLRAMGWRTRVRTAVHDLAPGCGRRWDAAGRLGDLAGGL